MAYLSINCHLKRCSRSFIQCHITYIFPIHIIYIKYDRRIILTACKNSAQQLTSEMHLKTTIPKHIAFQEFAYARSAFTSFNTMFRFAKRERIIRICFLVGNTVKSKKIEKALFKAYLRIVIGADGIDPK